MEGEQFIISSIKRAIEWTEAYAQSAGVPTEKAAGVLANICGFLSWDAMIIAMQKTRPSICDEQLGKKAVKKRHSEFRGRLVAAHDIDPGHARYIISHLPPSTEKSFRVFSLDKSGMHQRPSPNLLDMEMLRELTGFDGSEHLEEMVKQLFGDSLPEGFDDADLEDRVRLAGGTDPAKWFNILKGLGWGVLDDHTYCEDAEFGKPSMLIKDEVHGLVPVYLCASGRTPYDYHDNAANAAMAASLKHFKSCDNFGNTAYLLWKMPLRKIINGKHYCQLGMLLYKDSWKEVLVNRYCDSLAKTYRLNEDLISVDAEPIDLVDEHDAVFMGINRHLSGMDEPGAPKDGWKVMEMGSASGWNSTIIHH
jgi:hypothetical protein